jgi:hypothetical protein
MGPQHNHHTGEWDLNTTILQVDFTDEREQTIRTIRDLKHNHHTGRYYTEKEQTIRNLNQTIIQVDITERRSRPSGTATQSSYR